MKTDFPTVELCFVFAFTYCKVRVYKEEEQFARRLLERLPDVGVVQASASTSWEEIDTRVLMAFVSRAFAQISTEVKDSIAHLEKIL